MPIPPRNPELKAAYKKEAAKRYREYMKSLSPEAKAELARNKKFDKERREEDKKQRAEMKAHKAILKRAIAILQYMKKTDVLYYHHGRADSMMSDIIAALDKIKQTKHNVRYFRINNEEIVLPRHDEYNSYIWNYQGEGNNYLPICQFGCIWTGPFNSIYDVPLDGSYIFSIYDSGQRGLGSFNGITATKVEDKVDVPEVNPGAIIPITAF